MPFDQVKADLAVRFFEQCLAHTKGIFARKPFLLPPWQATIVRDLFGTVRRNGLRQYSTAYVEIPKKNGKTELAAGIALFGLLMDDEPGAEVYSAAATREQAALVFRVAAQMVRQSEELSDLCRIVDYSKTIYLKEDPNSFYKAISADAGTQDGINPHFVIFDELHRQKTRDLWDVLKMGSDTRTQPLLFAITTAGVHGESPVCWEQHEYARSILKGIFTDPSFYPVIYALGDGEDWAFEGEPARRGKPATGWFKANPALGDFLRVEKVREAAEKAKRVPAEQNSFRRLRLNEWTSQETRWIALAEWDACGEPFNPIELIGKPCYAGLDLSSTQDITALVLLFPEGDQLFVLPTFWLPGDGIAEKSRKDRVTYDLWAKQRLVELTPGNLIDYAGIRQRINELGEMYDIREIGMDPWNGTQLMTQLEEDGFKVLPIRQGFASLSAPSKEFERRILSRSLRHGAHPVLRWMMDCTSVRQDPAGNIKPVKPDRLQSTKRIDGIVAIINGLARVMVQKGFRSVYEDRGLRTV